MFLNRKNNDAPSEILNWRLWYGVFVFGLMGAARGVDEGLIGTTSTLPSFSSKFGLKDPSLSAVEQADRLSNITSMVQLGSIGGALIAFYITDKIGRLWATRQLCVLWVLGIAIFLAAGAKGSIGMVYAGRFIAGLGIGQTTVVAPTYLAEISPKFTRGLCVCMFSGSVYLGIMLGYFAVWGSSLHISPDTQLQWIIPNLLHVYFAVIIAVTSFMAIESPRWLLKVGKHEQAAKNLSALRNLPEDHWYVQSEIVDVQDQLEREREAAMGTKWYGVIRELIGSSANRYRLMLSVFSQLLGQWSGANSITIYAPEYFEMVGQSGANEKLFATAIFGVVKFISALLCAFFLIDYVGRKRSLMIGITLQFVAMLYMAGFLLADTNVDDLETQTSTEKRAATGAIVMIYLSGFGWAMGWNSIQYLINSEIYPLRLRAIGGSFAMTFHFVNQFGNSKAVPEMFISMTHGGTMMFFSVVTLIGLAWAWFFLPELAGKSLESVDAVFELPWYLIGRKGKELTIGQGGMVDNFQEKAAVEAETVENVRDAERKG
ncbi:Putative major facilitator, sugar transporter, major facilitator superfamily [Septoria linicola]|uniref:Major facilitator, sugar transporter, major facilitator superfamily n=1 Tax=Septoria linicola TaxID=215465 RepID=A0A9Q9EFE4_9PEZI|nr:putative major facilitator, sugar transporter, major facilitator superfamily [Septoria linicola]USW47582.1 Putative major facilitator, sugar transporter, major facilitator superfamily [Septoria linicola]